jgi:hypothetical protein
MPMKLEVGDIVRLKKPHPCGGYEWKIHRAGIDFRIECVKCGHQLMISRIKLEKSFKKLIRQSDEK